MDYDPSVDWEIVNYPSSAEEDVEITEKSTGSSRLNWMVNTGLSLGKKCVITGFLITSVPVILPPLAVVSALGVACSVPFGLVFASYACTERLMSRLLPPSQPDQNVDYLTLDDEEEMKDDRALSGKAGYEESDESAERKENEFVDNHDEKARAIGKFEHEGEDTNIRTNDNVVKNEDEKINVVARVEEKEGSLKDKEGKKEKIVEAEEHEKQHQDVSKGKNNINSKKGKKKGKKKIMEKLGFSEKEQKPVEGEDKKISDKNKEALLEEMKKTPVEKNSTLGHIMQEKHGVKENLGVEKVDSTEKVTNDSRGPSEKLPVNAAQEHEVVQKAVSGKPTEYYSQSKIIINDGETSLEVVSSTVMPKVEHAQDMPDFKDNVYEEDQHIWKEIDAIRVIVGLKTPRNASYFEELKELYLFTGIEPPSSDFSDFQSKLGFLKSVIGLK